MADAEPDWLETPARLYAMLADCWPKAAALRDACLGLPLGTRSQLDRLYYHADAGHAHASLYGHDKRAWDEVEEAVGAVCPVVLTDGAPPAGRAEAPWVVIKAGAASLRALASLANINPNPVNELFGGPSPLAATLTGGLLGAGLGYGAGAIGEQFLPARHFNKGRLRKTLALLGGLGGAAPGMAWGAGAMASNPESPGAAALLSGWPMRERDAPHPGGVGEAHAALHHALGKESAYAEPGEVGHPFEVDAFNRVVWGDHHTPMGLRAAATGLSESASVLRGGSDYVTAADVGRVAAGMGAGWGAGLLVGKTLGALAGLKPESQSMLQRTGLWAGLLGTVLPLAFRRV